MSTEVLIPMVAAWRSGGIPDDEIKTMANEFMRQQSLRCDRCSQYLVICGHDQPFLERVKTHRIDKASLKVKVR